MFVVLTVVRDLYSVICLPVLCRACLECVYLTGYLSRRLSAIAHVLVYVMIGSADSQQPERL